MAARLPFHVRRPAAVQVAVLQHRFERGGRPGVLRPGRHDVGMAEKDEQGRLRPPACPQVADLAEGQGTDPEAEGAQMAGEQVLAARVPRG